MPVDTKGVVDAHIDSCEQASLRRSVPCWFSSSARATRSSSAPVVRWSCECEERFSSHCSCSVNRRAVGEMVLAVCGGDVDEFVGVAGVGNSAGLLAEKGLLGAAA